jgi:hypothetical protein
MVFNATFNNISVIPWMSVLLAEDTRVPWEYHRPVISHWQTLSHNVVSITLRHERDSNSYLLVMGTDCIGSCKSNYHTIMTTTPPILYGENKLYSMRWRCLLCSRPTQFVHWNYSPRVDISLHTDTLLWFQTNKSLLLLCNVACFAEK